MNQNTSRTKWNDKVAILSHPTTQFHHMDKMVWDRDGVGTVPIIFSQNNVSYQL